jgi:D-proline reductase (dithiol) PrdB
MSDVMENETFAQFADSFAYGSRTDLNFKYLARLPPEEAARFFQELLWKVAAAYDDGNFERVMHHLYAWQVRGYAAVKGWTYEDGPFTPLGKPLAQARLALLTSSGHFVAEDDPRPFGIENMTQEEAMARIDDFLRTDPQLSEIPVDTPKEQLRVRHGGYDIRSALADPNVVFPLEHLRDLQGEGSIGDLALMAYSFVGACAQTPLVKRVAPRWVEILRQQQIDAVLLVPV